MKLLIILKVLLVACCISCDTASGLEYMQKSFKGCVLREKPVNSISKFWKSDNCLVAQRKSIPPWRRSERYQTNYCAAQFWRTYGQNRLLYNTGGVPVADGFAVTRQRLFPSNDANTRVSSRGTCWQFFSCQTTANPSNDDDDDVAQIAIDAKLHVPRSSYKLEDCESSRVSSSSVQSKFPNIVPPEFQRPNIIFVLLDDAGVGDFDIPVYRKHVFDSEYDTKHISNLAKSSLVFTEAYTSAAVCAPSRNAILGGMHASNSYIKGNAGYGRNFLLDRDKSLPLVMQQAGYQVGFAGKWGFCDNPLQHGVDYFFGLMTHRESHAFYRRKMYRYNANTRSGRYWRNRKLRPNYTLYRNRFVSHSRCTNPYSNGSPRCTHIEKETSKQALLMLNRMARKSKSSYDPKPFFMMYSSFLPHTGSYTNGLSYSNENVKAVDEVEDCVANIKNKALRDAMNLKPAAVKESECSHKTMMEKYIDSFVGDLLARLAYYKIEENTLVLLSSDNGPDREYFHRSKVNLVHDPILWGSNGGGAGYKRSMYQGGIRVPLLIHWPGVVSGKEITRPTSLVDLFPTFAHLAGAHLLDEGSLVDDLQGFSLVPTLLADSDNPPGQYNHDGIPSTFCLPTAMSPPHYEATAPDTCKWAIREGRYKLVKEGALPAELFDIENDPLETNPLSTNTFRTTIQQLEQTYGAMSTSIKSLVDPNPLQFSCAP